MKINRDELLSKVKEFCAAAPDKRFCPSMIYEDRVEVSATRNGEPLALFSATSNGCIRISMVLSADKKFRDAAGIKNNRISADVQTLFLEEGFNKVREKYNKLCRQVKPHIDAYYAEIETQEKAEAKLLREVGAYGVTPNAKVFRENGQATIKWLNSDGTIDIKLDGISREQLDAILAILGNPVTPKVSEDYAREKQAAMTKEEWEQLPIGAKQAYRTLAFEELYGKRN